MLVTAELGRTGRKISRIGLGGMWFSIEGRPDREQSKQVIRRAVDLGVTFIDTADVYCLDDDDLNHNERLVAETLTEIGDGEGVLVATKGGLTRPGGRWERDGRPERLREAALRSRDALGIETIALYQLHAPDPRVPFESSVEELAALQRDRIVGAVGLSNVDLDEVRAAEASRRSARSKTVTTRGIGPPRSRAFWTTATSGESPSSPTVRWAELAA